MALSFYFLKNGALSDVANRNDCESRCHIDSWKLANRTDLKFKDIIKNKISNFEKRHQKTDYANKDMRSQGHLKIGPQLVQTLYQPAQLFTRKPQNVLIKYAQKIFETSQKEKRNPKTLG